jgi:hypothetical protein
MLKLFSEVLCDGTISNFDIQKPTVYVLEFLYRALAIAFNLGRNKLPKPGPFSLGYSFRPVLLA